MDRAAQADATVKRLRTNDPCWCGSHQKLKRCHGDFSRPTSPVQPGRVAPPREVPADIARPWYVAAAAQGPDRGPVQIIDDPDDFARLKTACRVAAEVLAVTGAAVAAGVTTDELDAIAHAAYIERGAYPSTLHYQGFTKSICTSVNEVVCHGIGDDRPLRDGDIVNLDVTAFIDGMHGDTSATFTVGSVTPSVAGLVDTCREALQRGITAVSSGSSLGEIGKAIQPFAFSRGFGVVADYGGHGIGRHFHPAPHIDHVIHPSAFTIKDAMVFTIEPMLTAGSSHHQRWDDGWTEVAVDLLPSAQFEHTVIVVDGTAQVLTLTDDTARTAARLDR